MITVGGVNNVADMILFIRCYCGDEAVEKALQYVDNGESILNLFEKAEAIFKFRVEEIERGVLKALSVAFGK